MAMVLKILVLEFKILALEPKILAIGATNTGHWSHKYWPLELYFWAGRCTNIFEEKKMKKTSAQREYADDTFCKV